MDSINEIELQAQSVRLYRHTFMHVGSRIEVFGDIHDAAFCRDIETATYLVNAANNLPFLLDEIKRLRTALQLIVSLKPSEVVRMQESAQEALDKTEPDETSF